MDGARVDPVARRNPVGRLIVCTRCGDLIEVFEIPTPRINWRAFVCGQCLQYDTEHVSSVRGD